jgi:glucose/arabinose dehydrogenase/plastocyanin
MNQKKKILFIGLIFFSGCIFQNAYSESEFFIDIDKGSYDLGCELDNSCFIPYVVKIDIGNTVTWINNDDAMHVVVSENTEQPIFDSGFLKTNESFSHTFNTTGNYGYFCTLHPWMKGYVTIGNVEFVETQDDFNYNNSKPIVLDFDFKIEEFVSGLTAPINMEFVGEDLLVIEKNSGMVKHVKNGKLSDIPVLDVEVSNYGEHGLVGITSVENEVYLFFTESFHDGGLVLESRVYKYSWNGNKLVEPILINSFPGFATQYVGGDMASGLDGAVYLVTGDSHKMGLLQNHLKNESYRHYSDNEPNNKNNHLTIIDSLKELPSCVNVSFYHRTTNVFSHQADQPKFENNPYEMNVFNILGNLNSCLNAFFYENFSDGNWKYTSSIIDVNSKDDPYAIGIRNSFGLAVDPKTGYLWDTENGPDTYDEINLVSEKFNSGWGKIQGPSNGETLPSLPNFENYKYSDPEFSWELPVGVTAIEFHESVMFEKYKNFVFVADSNSGNVYKFKLDDTRTKIIFQSTELQDNVLNIFNDKKNSSGIESSDEILFAKNLGVVTDMKFGPDGALYIISIIEGKIYKISYVN